VVLDHGGGVPVRRERGQLVIVLVLAVMAAMAALVYVAWT
jgi:hypothetical protein